MCGRMYCVVHWKPLDFHFCEYRQNLRDAIRQDEKVDRKIARNQDSFEALDFNAAVGDSRMSPASAFVATIRGTYVHEKSYTSVCTCVHTHANNGLYTHEYILIFHHLYISLYTNPPLYICTHLCSEFLA